MLLGKFTIKNAESAENFLDFLAVQMAVVLATTRKRETAQIKERSK